MPQVELKELLDSLYEQGWDDRGCSDYDPRGNKAWQECFDYIAALAAVKPAGQEGGDRG